MKTLTVWRGVLIAVLATLSGGLALVTLPWLLGMALTLKLVISGLTLGYLLYLLWSQPSQAGKVTTLLAWLTLTATLTVFNPNPLIWLLVQTGFIWLIRCCLRPFSLTTSAADAMLSGLAVLASVATLAHSHSLWLAIWVFFLTQALHPWLAHLQPRSRSTLSVNDAKQSEPTGTIADVQGAFQDASRSADAALQRLLHP